MRIRSIATLWILVGLSTALSVVTKAQTPFWEPAPGPYGGTVVKDLVRLADGSILAASTGGVFRSVDEGLNWADASEGLTIRDVRALHVEDLGSVLAGTFGGGVFRLAPGSDRWIQTGLAASFVTALGETPGGVLMAGTVGALQVSFDLGVSWQERQLMSVTDLAASTSHSFATTTAGMYRSSDNGTTWTLASTGIQDLNILTVVVNAAGHVFAGVNPVTGGCAIYRSRGNGNIWTCIQPATDPVFVPALAFDGSGTLYAGGFKRIYISDDEGDHWTSHSTDGSSIRALLVSESVLLAGTFGYGILRSIDGGRSWVRSNSGLTSTIYRLLIDAEGTLFAGTEGGVFESRDRASTWTRVGGTEALVLPVTALALDTDHRLVAGTSVGVWRFDPETGWEEIGPPDRPAIRDLALAPDGRLFAAYHRGVYILSGQTWTELPLEGRDGLIRDVYAITFTTNGTLLAGTAWDSYRLSPGSPSWALMSTDNTRFFSAESFGVGSNGDVLAGSRFQGVLKSSDNGETWINLGTGLFGSEDVQAIAFDMVDNVYIGTNGNGVYWMHPFSQTWTPMSDGLNGHLRVQALTFDSRGNAYAGTQGGGLFRNASGGSIAVQESIETPSSLVLSGFYPNPFRDQTTLLLDAAAAGSISIQLFDMTGRKVMERSLGLVAAGAQQRIMLRLVDLSAGAYYCRILSRGIGQLSWTGGIMVKN